MKNLAIDNSRPHKLSPISVEESCPVGDGSRFAETLVKNTFPWRARCLARKRLLSKRFLLCAALAALIFHSEVPASEPSPAESIKGFFDLLLKRQAQEAANSGIFSRQEAKTGFIKEWTEKARTLSGYTVEGWTIEPTEGWAEVSIQSHEPSDAQPLKISLVKRDGLWKVAPEKDFKSNPSPLPTPPKIENLEDLVDVTSKRKNNRIELFAVNEAPFSLLFRLEMSLPASLRPDRPLPLQGILPPMKTPLSICSLQIVGRSSWKYSWSYTVKRADDRGEMVEPGVLTPLPEVSDEEDARFFVGGEYAYGLPYPAGKGYLIYQGPGGSFSHNEPGSLHAVDFSLAVGSEIAAARAGVVIGVTQKKPNNVEGETAPASMANEVSILHADGTIGVYAHLTTDGARVSFAERVERGQVIGLSGNSGYSRGPHLHFVILGYEERRSVSLPFGFLSADGTVITPRKGLILLADNDHVARIVARETTPRRVLRKNYEEFDTEIRYFAKNIDFLAVSKMEELLGIELSFSSLENLVSHDKLPRRVAIAPDGMFHPVLSLQLANFGERSAFTYLFRRVEAPGREHIPLRVERDAGNDYVVETRYFSNRIEFYAENKTSQVIVGSLDFLSMSNLTPKEKLPAEIHLTADASTHYLATLLIVRSTKGYSFVYDIGPPRQK